MNSIDVWSSILLVFLSVCSDGYCEEDYMLIVSKEDLSLRFLLLFGPLIVLPVIQHVCKNSAIPIPQGLLCISLSFIWGIISLYNEWFETASNTVIVLLHYMPLIFLPVSLYSSALRLDVHIFIKSLPQILIMSLPITILTACVTGLAMKMVIDVFWSNTDAILLGLVFAPINAGEILRRLRETSVHTGYVATLLESETLLSTAVSISFLKILLLYLQFWIKHWYQFVTHILRMIILGTALGYGLGYAGTVLMKMGKSVTSLTFLTVGVSFSSFYISEWIANAGVITITIVGIIMAQQCHLLSEDLDESIFDFWNTANVIISYELYFLIGIRLPVILKENNLKFKQYIIICVTYVVSVIVRFLAFLLFSPILSRTGYGMTFQNMVICVWGGLKNPICVNLAVLITEMYVDNRKSSLIVLHTVGVYILWQVVNASSVPLLFRALGLSEISVTRQINMNNCVKFIYEVRARMISILKMDKFLSDANWPLVITSTALKHPYKKSTQDVDFENIEEDDYFMRFRYTWCPNCEKSIHKKPTPREMREMLKEANIRILKLRKTSYSRQYENGMISKEGLRSMHQAVEMAMDTEDAVIELDGLFKLFSKENRFLKYLRNFFERCLQTKSKFYKAPKTRWTYICYTIVHSRWYYLFINIIVLLNIAQVIYHFATINNKITYTHIILNVTFSIIWILEFWLKVYACTMSQIFSEKIRNYFRSHWNKVDFIIILLCLILLAFHNISMFYDFTGCFMEFMLIVLLILKLFRLLFQLKLFNRSQPWADELLKYLTYELGKPKAIAYELGKSYIQGEDEILENLQHIVDNDKIRELIKRKTEFERNEVNKKLGLTQRKHPWVAAIVKTKIAIRTVLNSMGDDISDLKITGWVDDIENNKLLDSLEEKHLYINTIKSVELSSPKLILKEVPFIGEDEELVDYFFSNISMKKFNAGDIVFENGRPVEGIYILITGLFLTTYTPRPETLNDLTEYGILPTVDNLISGDYTEHILEYLIPGNTIGKLATITNRFYDGTVIAETHGEAYVLKRDILKTAIDKDVDPVAGLKCRIWKMIAFKKVLSILSKVPSYRSYTKEKLKYLIEQSFVPDLTNFKNFVINDMIKDVVLLEGVVLDYYTKDLYTAPCYIPRAVHRLVLPSGSLMNVKNFIEAKLIIIPVQNCNGYEIMLKAENICELVDKDTNLSLQNILKMNSLDPSNSDRDKVFTHIQQKILDYECHGNEITYYVSSLSNFGKLLKLK